MRRREYPGCRWKEIMQFVKPERAIAVRALFIVGLLVAVLASIDDLAVTDHSLTRNDLWFVINKLCVPAERYSLPSPCSMVVHDAHFESGYVILSVSKGHLVISPTQHISGIESHELWSSKARNYWQAAWLARERIDRNFLKTFDRSDIALAVNSIKGRSQDQFHIHTACVRPDVNAALAEESPEINQRWRLMRKQFRGAAYSVRWLAAATLEDVDVLNVFDPDIRQNDAEMGRQTLVLVGGWKDGKAGFFVLNAQTTGDRIAHGEWLLDDTCQT